MRGSRSPLARRVLELHRSAPLADRVHVVGRWWTCPFPAIEREVPEEGRVLEVGCGHGLASLLIALASRRRSVRGIDVDPGKVDAARRAASRLREGEADVTFEVRRVEEVDDGPFDAVVVADVCYLLSPGDRDALLRRAAGLVGPGGVLVLKEVSRQPVWKWQISEVQERLATGALGMTQGETVHFAPVDELAAPLVAAGLDLRHRRVDRGYPYAHHLFVGRRP